MQTLVISDIEMTEIFGFNAVTSYTSSVHGLDYVNNNTTPLEGFLLIITETGRAENPKNTRKLDFAGKRTTFP